MALTQRQQVLKAGIEFCESNGSRTFALDDFQARMTPRLAHEGQWSNKTPPLPKRALNLDNALDLIYCLSVFIRIFAFADKNTQRHAV